MLKPIESVVWYEKGLKLSWDTKKLNVDLNNEDISTSHISTDISSLSRSTTSLRDCLSLEPITGLEGRLRNSMTLSGHFKINHLGRCCDSHCHHRPGWPLQVQFVSLGASAVISSAFSILRLKYSNFVFPANVLITTMTIKSPYHVNFIDCFILLEKIIHRIWFLQLIRELII